MCRKLTCVGLLLMVLNLSRLAFSQVEIIGPWQEETSDLSRSKVSGTNRLLVFIAHEESTMGDPALTSVTYGGREMTKVIERSAVTTYGNYVAAFILNDANIIAATDDKFIVTWNATTSSVSYASVFLSDVNQTDPNGAEASNGTTSSTNPISTTPLDTNDGDMVILGATCGDLYSYTLQNGFVEGTDQQAGTNGHTGATGYKSATGAAETPSANFDSSMRRQVIIGFVVQEMPSNPGKASNPDPANDETNVSVTTDLSWTAGADATAHDVYFGTNSNAHSNPKHTVYTASYDPPGDLLEGTTYYWAVDSNAGGAVTTGDDWSFTTYAPVIIGDLVADYILSQDLTEHYASACSYYGVLLYSEVTGNTGLKDSVIAAFPPEYYTGATMPPEGSQDKNAYGILPFELYRQTGDANYLTSALYLADKEFENPLPNGLANYDYTRFWIDDTYMIGSLQAQAYKSMGDITYANHATAQLLGYMGEVENLQQPNGLFHHTLSAPFHWGRGNGWAAAAMTEVLSCLPEDDPNRPLLLSKYQAMMAGLVNCQDASGMWYQVLDMGSDPRNWVETSCTGMFVFALATGVKEGWLPEVPYKQAALDGWDALANFVNPDGAVREVCMWMSQSSDVTYYLNRPREVGNAHGQAAAIWAATAIEILTGDDIPPAAPTGLSATAGNGSVSLDWNDNVEVDLDGYNVYRSLTSGSGYGKLNVALVTDSDYIDNTVTNGTPYYYIVMAVDVNVNESGNSNEVTATPWYQTCAELQAGTGGLKSDLDDDCYVNYADLEIIVSHWLSTDCTGPENCEGADFEPTDGTVDFFDYSDFAVQWLMCDNPQDANCDD